MKRWLVRIGMVILSTFSVLLVIEVIWQLVGDPRIAENREWLESVAPHSRLGAMGMFVLDEDADISFRLAPGFKATIEGQTYRINSHGMRGPEVAKARKPGIKRILVVGDSYAFGYGVDDSATISAQLQARLEPKHAGIEVLNMGVPAYHTGQEVRQLERDGVTFAPDLVILIYYSNDNLGPTLIYAPEFKAIYFDEMPFSYGTRRVLSRSIVYYITSKAYTKYLKGSGVFDTRGLLYWSITRERILRMVKTCRDAKIKFLMVALPEMTYSRELFDPEHEINKAHDRLLTFAEDDGIPIMDMRAPLLERRKPVEELFVVPQPPKRDTHFNQQGFKILVDNLVLAIEASKAL